MAGAPVRRPEDSAPRRILPGQAFAVDPPNPKVDYAGGRGEKLHLSRSETIEKMFNACLCS